MGFHMGFHIHGSITIDPPLTWAQMRRMPCPDGIIAIQEREEVETDEGTLFRKYCSVLAPAWASLKNGDVLRRELQKIIDVVGPEHTFSGHFDCVDDDTYDKFRLAVTATPGAPASAVIVNAATVWPDDLTELKRAVATAYNSGDRRFHADAVLEAANTFIAHTEATARGE